MTESWIFETFESVVNITSDYNDNFYLGIYPELFLIFSIPSLLVFLVIIDYIYNHKIILINLSGKILIALLIITLFLINNNSLHFLDFNEMFVTDHFTIFLKSIIIVFLIILIITSLNYLKLENISIYEYFILISLSTLGMLTIISSNDLISMYIAIELQSLCFYILATIKIYSNFSTEAGLKYFILGAFSSGILLFGCSFVYGSLGTTNFSEIRVLVSDFTDTRDNPTTFTLGIIFIIVALLFKIGSVPFHMWLPDVYEGVATSVTALYSILPKVALFSLLIRFNISCVYEEIIFIQTLILICSVSSIIIGTLGALYQTKIKRLLAYSAITHVGFLLIGLSSFNVSTISSLFFYIIVYMLISINIFTILLTLRKVDNNLKIKKINEIILLFKSNPLLAINFSIILFSIAGIPPLLGFYSKFYIFLSAIRSEIILVSLIAALFSVLASMYYIRLIKLMFFKQTGHWALFYDISKTESLIISLTLFFNIFFFCYPEIFIVYLYNIFLKLFL